MVKFHYLARAVISSAEHILLAREVGADSTFLPGGHVEYGEPAEGALVREIIEETGLKVEVGRFLGAVEATWYQNGQLNAELNLIFEVKLTDLDHLSRIKSDEDHLEFLWVERSEVGSYNLLPEPMQKLIKNLSGDFGAFWGSRIV